MKIFINKLIENEINCQKIVGSFFDLFQATATGYVQVHDRALILF